jgi:hypothetical protein
MRYPIPCTCNPGSQHPPPIRIVSLYDTRYPVHVTPAVGRYVLIQCNPSSYLFLPAARKPRRLSRLLDPINLKYV